MQPNYSRRPVHAALSSRTRIPVTWNNLRINWRAINFFFSFPEIPNEEVNQSECTVSRFKMRCCGLEKRLTSGYQFVEKNYNKTPMPDSVYS